MARRVRDYRTGIEILSDRRRIPGNPMILAIADPNVLAEGRTARILAEVVRSRPEVNHYARSRGLLEFVQSVADFYSQYHVKIEPEQQVLVTNGSNEAIFIALFGSATPGAEFILPNPTYADVAWFLKMLGTIARYVPLKQDYHLDLPAIRRAITNRTKGIFLCNPNNPNGAVYTKDELRGVLEIAREKNVMIICDENFCKFTYDGRKHVSICSLPDAFENVILINGLSKVFGLTGWRLGYLVANQELVAHLQKVASCMGGAVNTAIQYAGSKIMRTPIQVIERMVGQYERSRNLLVKLLREQGIDCPLPEGTFMVFPRVPDSFRTSESFVEFLHQRAGVMVNPGSIWGPRGKRNFRLVYGASEDEIKTALGRIQSVRTW